MTTADLHVVASGPLRYLLSLPQESSGTADSTGPWPLLCFLHGYGEGPPMPIRRALTLHGPMARTSSPLARAEFVVVAPQLPRRGDIWYAYAEAVQEIVQQVHARAAHRADPARMFLTGFSFGGNGVFDLALAQPDVWAALWAVDPTRVPPADPGRPAWLSSGEASRHSARAFIERLRLEPLRGMPPGGRVYRDDGEDHVGTARRAYGDDDIYRWLLSKRLPAPNNG